MSGPSCSGERDPTVGGRADHLHIGVAVDGSAQELSNDNGIIDN